jgi:hypothetical protein
MGDIFKTKDVLYEIPGGDSVSMRRVRGVYIAGPYLPIHYENNLMMITRIEHTTSKIVDYTERTVYHTLDSPDNNHGRGVMSLCDMDFNTNVNITYYSTQTTSTTLDDFKTDNGHGVMALCDMDFTTDVSLVLYTTGYEFEYIDNTSNGVMALCDVGFATGITYENYYYITGFVGHDDCIMISRLDITKASITDGS